MDTPLPTQLAQRDAPRLAHYQKNLTFFNGQQWEGRSRQRRITFNYAKVFVEKVSSYVMTNLDFTVDPNGQSDQATATAAAAQTALREVYETNYLAELDYDAEVDTAILGDGCFKITWDVDAGRVRITTPDVQGIFCWWVGDDTRRLWRLASRYTLDAEALRLLHGVQLTNMPGNSQTATVIEEWTDQVFTLWVNENPVESKPNPYGFIPFIVYPNLREPKKFWGVSDLPTLMEPARELNRSLSQLSVILELSGNPIAVLENIEGASDIAVTPGAIWEIPEKAKAYLLDLLQGGGINLHIDYINLIYRVLHDLSETPRTAFGDNSSGLSGIALEMELNPLLQKVHRKRLLRTAVLNKRNEMILRLLEKYTGVPYAPYRTRTVWGPVLPQDKSRIIADEVTLANNKLHSHKRAMQELGIDDTTTEWATVLEEQAQIAPVQVNTAPQDHASTNPGGATHAGPQAPMPH